MNGRGFRLQQIRVEGFKGFTVSQTIPINGKHLFILGPNSYGKSSIVEAIRWGLFGSTRRPGEVVANEGYTGSCRVELSLERGDGRWNLKRTLIRGVSGGSDADIVDKLGQSHPLREVLPQLESAPAGEGMHIIYAAQSAPLRRPAEDVSPFERTIYSYLGLTDVRVAISRLEDFIELQEATEKRLGEKVDEKRNSIESELSRLIEQRRRIIENPPWGGGSIPTQEDTTKRIEEFVKELSAVVPSESVVAGVELGSLIREVEVLVDRVSSTTTSEVEAALRDNGRKLQQGQSLSTELSGLTWQIQNVTSEISATEQSLAKVLAGETIDMLTKAIEDVERQVEETALLHDLQKKARMWLEHHLHDREQQHCPVCEQATQTGDLLGNLVNRIELASSQEAEIVAKRDTLRLRHEEALHLDGHLSKLAEKRVSLQQEWDKVSEKVREFLGPGFENLEIGAALQERIKDLDSIRMTLEKQLREATELQQEWKRKLGRLQEEVRFHRIQEQLLEFQRQQRQVERVQEELKTLTLFGDSVRAITDALRAALNNTLKSALPGINEELTEAFEALTEHPAYNRVFIDEDSLPRLELRVASDDAPLPGWQPSQVLNGQALNALELVPYFAFSELTDVPLEVYLLLLDDPTQSFDSHHIDILVAKLAELGKRVQLIVASHEVDHFQRLLPKYFATDDYEVVHVRAFSRQDGPVLETTHGGY
ncbi:hypothetical protein M1N21_00355 [Dehalococcoidia bacterium]|nr:hypothetical protein [Dehalococcoidia bacterium]